MSPATEVSAGADGSRCAPRARVRSAGGATSLAISGSGRDAAQARGPGRGRRRAEAGSADEPGAGGDQALKRENFELRRANEILKAASGFSRPSSTQTVRGERVHRHASRPARRRADLSDPGRVGVRVLPARDRRAVSPRASRTSGSPAGSARCMRPTTSATATARVHAQLIREDEHAGRDQVARLMRISGHPRREAAREAVEDHDPRSSGAAAPLISSGATSPHRRRTACGSATSPTSGPGRAGCTSRSSSTCTRWMIVGWQLACHMRTTLVLDALRMALGLRAPGADFQLVAHTDQGSQAGMGSARRQFRAHVGQRETRQAVPRPQDRRARLPVALPAFGGRAGCGRASCRPIRSARCAT